MNILIDQSVGEMTTPLWFFDVFFHISLGHFLYELFHRNFLISTSSSTKQQETFCRMEIENSNSAGYFKNIQEFSTFLILNPLQPDHSNFTSLNATKGKPLKSRGIIIPKKYSFILIKCGGKNLISHAPPPFPVSTFPLMEIELFNSLAIRKISI